MINLGPTHRVISWEEAKSKRDHELKAIISSEGIMLTVSPVCSSRRFPAAPGLVGRTCCCRWQALRKCQRACRKHTFPTIDVRIGDGFGRAMHWRSRGANIWNENIGLNVEIAHLWVCIRDSVLF
jgi:hypothetical protein